jgi:hypothetical protein
MFDHCKHVEGWTTMACHVYDPIYFRVMTIVMFDMQVIKGCGISSSHVGGLLKVMKTNGVDNLQFRGFIINIIHTN